MAPLVPLWAEQTREPPFLSTPISPTSQEELDPRLLPLFAVHFFIADEWAN